MAQVRSARHGTEPLLQVILSLQQRPSPCASMCTDYSVSRSESFRAAIIVVERSTDSRVGASTYSSVV